jgi:adenine-specific DNA-methyltransferase
MLSSKSDTVITVAKTLPRDLPHNLLWQGDVEKLLDRLPLGPFFDLIVSSPPYNIGKPYEQRSALDQYEAWQSRVLDKLVSRLAPNGSL